MQIVETRLAELESKADPSQLEGMTAFFARTQGLEIRRDDLASWDASARAWLESANHVKKREETQLKLIIKNIPSIRGFGTTYSDVMKNWKIAMLAVQKSIEGSPQDFSNGSVLLGFLSWHIFPDIQVFSPDKLIQFQDELIKPGGIITLGLETTGRGDTGVRWSLSLSHLRYYGDPVLVERSIDDGDRLTVQELRLISLGSFIHSWTRLELVDIIETAKCFSALGDVLQLDMTESMESSSGFPPLELSLEWITPLIEAARDILKMDGKDKENALSRVEYGRRRGRNFLDPDFRNNPPMFGLTNRYLQFRMSNKLYHAEANMEPAIEAFRSLSHECDFHENDAIICPRMTSQTTLVVFAGASRSPQPLYSLRSQGSVLQKGS
ncbi:hypothetical protein Ct61P_11412 [Colletotrichum tofieldiae]|nr:hypothetical protein Ct61P_11412 [Colletotrichum tofieldiae]